MKKVKYLGLKNRFTLFNISAILFILFIQGCVLFYIIQLNGQRSQKYVESIANNVTNTISTTTTSLERAGYTFTLNQAVSLNFSKGANTKYQEDFSSIFEITKFIFDYNPDLLDVIVIEQSGRSTSFFAGVNEILMKELKKYYNFSDMKNTERKFFFFPSNSQFSSEYFVYFVPIFDISNTQVYDKKEATAILINKVSTIKNLISSIDSKTASFALLNSNNDLIASNYSTGNNTEKLNRILNNKVSFKVEKNIQTMGIKLEGVLTASAVDENMSFLTVYLIITVLILVAILFASSVFVRRNVTQPIINLNGELEEISDHSQNLRVSLGDSYDINLIVQRINSMLTKLDLTTQMNFDTQNRLYETEIRRNEAELYALQSQINPHFLYNTLQCVRGLAILHNVEEIATISTAMSELFRYSIKGKEYVSIEEEINIVKLYLSIINIRFSGKYTFKIDVDDNILMAKTIKMIVQPIVENAVQHGLADMEENGCLSIKCELSGEVILFKIIDNGPGILPQELAYIVEVLKQDFHESLIADNRCLGLFNINRRIKLNYGPEYGIAITSNTGGTEVVICIPANDPEN